MQIIPIDHVITKKDGVANGYIRPIYHNYRFPDYPVNFVYITSVLPHSAKGPHMHLKRRGMLVPVRGKVSVVLRENDVYTKVELDETKPFALQIPVGVAFLVENNGEEEAVLINLADRAWSPDDTDSPTVSDWKYS